MKIIHYKIGQIFNNEKYQKKKKKFNQNYTKDLVHRKLILYSVKFVKIKKKK